MRQVRSEAARAAVERADADEDADALAQRMADMEAAWQASAGAQRGKMGH